MYRSPYWHSMGRKLWLTRGGCRGSVMGNFSNKDMPGVTGFFSGTFCGVHCILIFCNMLCLHRIIGSSTDSLFNRKQCYNMNINYDIIQFILEGKVC